MKLNVQKCKQNLLCDKNRISNPWRKGNKCWENEVARKSWLPVSHFILNTFQMQPRLLCENKNQRNIEKTHGNVGLSVFLNPEAIKENKFDFIKLSFMAKQSP